MSPAQPSRPLDPHRPVLLIGAGGMLWRAWHEVLTARHVPHESPGLELLDLTRPETLERAVTPHFGVVVNCAGWTDVDGAEKQEVQANAINGTGVGALAARCKAAGAVLVHYSTDYVFDGQATRPYDTQAPLRPLNAYGRSKALGEKLLIESGCEHLLIRTSWMYAPWGKNFVRTMAAMAAKKPVLRVVNDQRGRPTSASHLARTTLRLLEAAARGIYHVTDGGECSWFEFAQAIVHAAHPATRVDPCLSQDWPTPARRPAYSVLDLTRTERLVGLMPPWQHNLAEVMKTLEP